MRGPGARQAASGLLAGLVAGQLALAAAGGVLFLGERLNKWGWTGVALAFAGARLLIVEPILSPDSFLSPAAYATAMLDLQMLVMK